MRTMPIKRLILPVSAILFAIGASGAAPTVLTDLAAVRAACQNRADTNRAFDVEVNLMAYFRRAVTKEWILTVGDGTNTLQIYELNRPGSPARSHDTPAVNDRLRLRGILYDYRGGLYPGYQSATLLARQPLDARADITPDDLARGDLRGRPVRLTGVIRDLFRDESDPNYAYLTLLCRGRRVPVLIRISDDPGFDPTDYIGRTATLTGIVDDADRGLRHFSARKLSVTSLANVQRHAPTTAADGDLPPLSDLRTASRDDIATRGRHQCLGTVRAIWQRVHLLVETDGGELVTVQLLKPRPPPVGARVRVAGFPESYIYFLGLAGATWEAAAGPPRAAREPADLSLRTLQTDPDGQPKIDIATFGRRIRLTGIVRFLPTSPSRDARFQIESDGVLVPVDASACPRLLDGLALGARIAVTGTYVLDMGTSANGDVPRARGFFLVPQTAADLAVLSRPPWWTPRQFLAVIGLLLSGLAAIIAWNIALARQAERRGRELADAHLARALSDLKAEESKRLAVELHDSLSQTLTGISMEVDTARELTSPEDTDVRPHLTFASRAIDSCRTELRNCLWDLRSRALDDTDFVRAIRRTLCVNLPEDRLRIRFNVPRERLSDATAHGILRTLRELVANALRHGHARRVSIAGAIDGDRLRFSVRDDGVGFDPAQAPGAREGHFGLQGIRERLASLGGAVHVSSAPGTGTKVTIALDLPRTDNESSHT